MQWFVGKGYTHKIPQKIEPPHNIFKNFTVIHVYVTNVSFMSLFNYKILYHKYFFIKKGELQMISVISDNTLDKMYKITHL